MLQNAAGNSISTEFRALKAAWFTMFRERFYLYGKAYLLDWTVRPIFTLAIAALIYLNGSNDLAAYVVVALAAHMFLQNSIYFVGEILDRERLKGTLAPLFLAPCHRMSWMAGYAAAGIGETVIRAGIILGAGMLLFGVRLDPNYFALLIVFPIYLLSLTGIALILSGIGLIVKNANPLSNLVTPIFLLLGGIYFPADQLPSVLRVLAYGLPISYAMQAITSIMIDHASLADVQSSLLPLIGFAIVSPIIGVLAFSYLDTLVRRRGEVDLY